MELEEIFYKKADYIETTSGRSLFIPLETATLPFVSIRQQGLPSFDHVWFAEHRSARENDRHG